MHSCRLVHPTNRLDQSIPPNRIQGPLTVEGTITGSNRLTIMAGGANITGDTLIDGALAVTGTPRLSTLIHIIVLVFLLNLAWDPPSTHRRHDPPIVAGCHRRRHVGSRPGGGG